MAASSDYGVRRMVGELETVGLADTISNLGKGLHTPIAHTGWPPSAVELQQLKFANAQPAAQPNWRKDNHGPA